MKKSIFHIDKMDCPSEEQLIRMQLDSVEGIEALSFDFSSRNLSVFHTCDPQILFHALDKLNLGTSILSSEETSTIDKNDQLDRKLLWQVLSINFFFFVVEGIYGWLAHSLGLMADALDMLADSLVYALSLFALNLGMVYKRRIARLSGAFQLLLAVLGFYEVVNRYFFKVSNPDFTSMMVVSFFALIGNAVCLWLLMKSKSKEINIKASLIFTSNDVIANLGVILAGFGVMYFNHQLPDLIIGLIIFVLVAIGAYRIIKL